MIGIGAVARATPDAPAIVSRRGVLSFAELDDRQRRIAGALHAHGLREGDRVAVMASNRTEIIELTIGALRAGILPVPIHHGLTERESAFILEDSGARVLFTDKADLSAHPQLELMVSFGDAYERLVHDASPAELADVARGRPMHYTSGTTGHPKGVWSPLLSPDEARRVSAAFVSLWKLSAADAHLVCSPLSHSAPLRFAWRTLEAGGRVALLGAFDAEEVLATIDMFSITSTFVVPTHLERLLQLAPRKLRSYDLSSMTALVHAGAPIRPSTKERVIDLFPEGSVWEFYGSTEGQATRISSSEWIRKRGSVGTALPGARITIVDEEGDTAPPGAIGHIFIDDPQVPRWEYWRRPEATRAAWGRHGYTVGDIGSLDEDGYLFLNGRSDDTIISGGVNVYPAEVELVLVSHPAVQEALVFGEPDDEWGQRVCAQVVAAYGQPLDPDTLRAWARERMAGFKVPKEIELVAELPRTPTGKLRRIR